MMRFSGPMFEPSKSGDWESIYKKEGAHYNIYGSGRSESAMDALRKFFTDATDYSLNLILFSTSGVHGTYRTIEDAEKELQAPAEGDEDGHPDVTFLIIQPRTVTLRYGNCEPQNQADIDFLKAIRERSRQAMVKIGWPDPQGDGSVPVDKKRGEG